MESGPSQRIQAMSPSHEEAIGRLLRRRKATLAVAESCTGGLLGYRITSVSGSSDYFLGGVIAYANAVKVRELGVDPAVLEKEGAVSEPVARQMACGVRERFGADFGIGITGVAGPGGGTDRKLAGSVYIALADARQCSVYFGTFSGHREAVREASARKALEMIESRLILDER